MPRLLEVCCGTAQVSRCFDSRGWEVVAIEWDPNRKAEQLWAPGEFYFVHSSPDCCESSIAESTAHRDFAKRDSIVIACFDIIRYLTTNTDKQVSGVVETYLYGVLTQTGAYASVGTLPQESGVL